MRFQRLVMQELSILFIASGRLVQINVVCAKVCWPPLSTSRARQSSLSRGGDEGLPYAVEKYIHNQKIVVVIVVIII
jgi:hypothetical protein